MSPRGGILIFSYIRRLGPFLGIQNFEFKYFWGVFRKNEYFSAYEDFMDIFFGSSQNWSFLCVLRSFLKVTVQNGDIILSYKNSNYTFVVLDIPDIFFLVNRRCWVQVYVCRKKNENTPPGL